MIGGLHTGGADTAEIPDCLLDVLVDDAVGLLDADSSEGEDAGLDGTGHTGGDFHGTSDLGAVTHHTGDVADHVLDRRADLLVAASTQVEDRKSTRLNSSHSAKSRMPSSA